LKFISKGYSNKEIATKLDISDRTVKNHIFMLFKKIGVVDRTQAAVYALRKGLIK
jgi:DNA-binding NarL/FixJ family response regulator